VFSGAQHKIPHEYRRWQTVGHTGQETRRLTMLFHAAARARTRPSRRVVSPCEAVESPRRYKHPAGALSRSVVAAFESRLGLELLTRWVWSMSVVRLNGSWTVPKTSR
jgi:hypothetical protein